jgi:hypothetical protein
MPAPEARPPDYARFQRLFPQIDPWTSRTRRGLGPRPIPIRYLGNSLVAYAYNGGFYRLFFSTESSSADGLNHIARLNSNTLGCEDWIGGDYGFDDVVAVIKSIRVLNDV